jgi:hypothetical protein
MPGFDQRKGYLRWRYDIHPDHHIKGMNIELDDEQAAAPDQGASRYRGE